MKGKYNFASLEFVLNEIAIKTFESVIGSAGITHPNIGGVIYHRDYITFLYKDNRRKRLSRGQETSIRDLLKSQLNLLGEQSITNFLFDQGTINDIIKGRLDKNLGINKTDYGSILWGVGELFEAEEARDLTQVHLYGRDVIEEIVDLECKICKYVSRYAKYKKMIDDGWGANPPEMKRSEI